MDIECYDLLFLRIKESLTYSSDLNGNAFKGTQFSSTLIECYRCVSKVLELSAKLVQETNFHINELCGYIDKAIILLQMLSDFIKNILESAAMGCCTMKSFPTTTGTIILTVFSHCKDSEYIYGNHLRAVETHLKELFRTCHELQLTYLMAIEKHFIFDLTEMEEQKILIEALNINMEIGKIAQALDIKTMAEQWKAYTVICEKYSNFLLDKNIYNKCTQLFATIIRDKIQTAMETKNDNKCILRSLKVANFTIKILTKVSNLFKYALTNNYQHVVELMEYVYLHCPAYLLLADKTQQFVNLALTNFLTPIDSLCNILIQDEKFLDCVYKVDAKTLEANAFLGYLILILSIIKAMQIIEDRVLNSNKRKLIDCIYRILPLGHYWFNMGLQFQIKDGEKYFSLYEYLLVHALALSTTFTSEEYSVLEKYMFEAILSTDCYSAMFSSNLWVLLIRIANHLASNTLSSLVKIYQELGKHASFQYSPQEVHLKYLIGKIFEVSSNEDKRIISKQIQPQNTLWSVLKVSNLPEALQKNIEALVLENFNTSFHAVFESQHVTEKEIDNLVQSMKIAATCNFFENSVAVEQCVVKLWSKMCLKNGYIPSDSDTADVVWYFKYLEALVALTDCIALKLNSASIGKILHNMSTLLYKCNTEITLLLLDIFCKVTFNRIEDENQLVIDAVFKDTYKVLMRGVETWFKPYLLNVLTKYKYNKQFQDITSPMVDSESLKNEFYFNCDFKNYLKTSEWKQQLIAGARYEYIHKCKEIVTDGFRENGALQNNSNFDLGEFLLNEEFEEPSSKKPKLDINETDSLVQSLENNASLLSQADPASLYDYKQRIIYVIDTLRNIVS